MSIGFEQWVTASVLEHVFGFTPGMLEKVRGRRGRGRCGAGRAITAGRI